MRPVHVLQTSPVLTHSRSSLHDNSRSQKDRTMSADKTLDIKANTDNGNIHALFLKWAADVRGQPAVRVTREDILAAWEQDPKLAGHVAKIKREVPKGSTMWITDAGTGSS